MCYVNLNRSNDEKVTHLTNSLLYNSVLLGKEIRFSDLIKYFLEKFNCNLFNNTELTEGGYKVFREKSHNDLRIETLTEFPDLGICLLPLILVENKLKSLPDDEQLKDYTETFINQYIDKFKQDIIKPAYDRKITKKKLSEYKVHLLRGLTNLKFYLLSPIHYRTPEPIAKDLGSLWNGEEHKHGFQWEVITYEALGKKIGNIVNNITIPDGYERCFWKDFSEILMDFTVITPELQKPCGTDFIIKSFEPKKLCRDFLLKDLYAKTVASYCAEYLSKSFQPPNRIFNCKHPEMSNNEIIVSHGFSNGDGIFQTSRKSHGDKAKKGVVYDGITYLIQYQAGYLKKGLLMHKKHYNFYFSWIGSNWGNCLFEINKDKLFEYEDKPEGYYYYYSRHKIPLDRTIEEITNLMAFHIINDNVPSLPQS